MMVEQKEKPSPFGVPEVSDPPGICGVLHFLPIKIFIADINANSVFPSSSSSSIRDILDPAPKRWRSRGGVGGDSWNFHVSKEVTGEIGKTASLPCVFTHPHKAHDGAMTVIWRINQPYDGNVVFKCVSNSSHEPCRPIINYMNKFKLLGNPRSNNISIRIENLTWADSNKYYCRVELSRDRHDKYEAKSGTRLHLSAPPRILNITVVFDHYRGYHAVCVAEGEPAPSLVWTDPFNRNKDTVLTRAVLKHQMSTELHYLKEDGKYTCSAVNSHGKAEGSVYFFKFRQGSGGHAILALIWITLGAKLLVVFIMLCVNKDTVLTRAVLKHQMSTELHYLKEDGKYTCSAVNSHGKAEGSVYFFKFRQGSGGHAILALIWITLGAKLLFFEQHELYS
ncbi:sialic acid-binding Ig-like lectin 15 [Pelodytes ibericus]